MNVTKRVEALGALLDDDSLGWENIDDDEMQCADLDVLFNDEGHLKLVVNGIVKFESDMKDDVTFIKNKITAWRVRKLQSLLSGNES